MYPMSFVTHEFCITLTYLSLTIFTITCVSHVFCDTWVLYYTNIFITHHLYNHMCIQGIPQQPGNGQIVRLIEFSPRLLCCQKWKRQSENKIWLCFAYWFSMIASLVWFSVVYFKNQLWFSVKVNFASLSIKRLRLSRFFI